MTRRAVLTLCCAALLSVPAFAGDDPKVPAWLDSLSRGRVACLRNGDERGRALPLRHTAEVMSRAGTLLITLGDAC